MSSKKSINPLTYTNLVGETIYTDTLDWLEDGVDEDGEPCARYYLGEEYGDSQSVWLDDNMMEVRT